MSTPWSSLTGKPFTTVSPVGTAQGYSTNNGADFGPDTTGTHTSGIQEALNSINGSGGNPQGGTVYCLAGPNPATYPFVLAAPITNTANYQTVIFEPGSVVQVTTALSGAEALIWVAESFPSSLSPSQYASYVGTNAYHHIRWLGNGCVIDLQTTGSQTVAISNVFEYSLVGPFGPLGGGSGSPISGDQAHHVEIDGFEIKNIAWAVAFIQTDNGSGFHPNLIRSSSGYLEQAGIWKISRLYAHTWAIPSGFNIGPGIDFSAIGISGVRLFDLDGLFIDGSNIPSSVGSNPLAASMLTLWSNRGDTADISIKGCTFISNGLAGDVFWLYGSIFYPGGDITSRIHFFNCIFEANPANAPNPVLGGSGGATIEDSYSYTQSQEFDGVITDVEFRSCEFINVAIQFQTSGAAFGYCRFVDSKFWSYNPTAATFTLNPNWYNSALSERGPNSSDFPVTLPTKTLSPNQIWIYENTGQSQEFITASGGSGVLGSINGGSYLAGPWGLAPGDVLSVTYNLPGPPTLSRILGPLPPASTGTVTITNNDGFDQNMIVLAESEGTIYPLTILRNGLPTGVGSGVFFMRTGDTLEVTWTSLPGPPTLVKIPE